MAIAGIDEFLRNVSFLNLNRCVVDVEPFARHIIHSREKLSPAESVVPRDDAMSTVLIVS